jgi:hypothetical protein
LRVMAGNMFHQSHFGLGGPRDQHFTRI